MCRRKFQFTVLTMSLAFACSLLVAADARAGAVYAIDFGTATSPVATGFTGVVNNGSSSVPNTGTGALGSITAAEISADNHLDESSGSTTDLTRDYIFDDGTNQAVGVDLTGLANGEWKLEIWSWDDSSSATMGNQELEVHDGGTNVSFLINGFDIGAMKDNAGWETAPAVTTTFTSSNANEKVIVFLLSRIAGDTNQTRMNAVRLTQIPEPTSVALLGLGLFGLVGPAMRRRRR